jgi:hypothetical protein
MARLNQIKGLILKSVLSPSPSVIINALDAEQLSK